MASPFILKIVHRAIDEVRKLSPREKGLLAVAVFVGFIMLSYKVVTDIKTAFAEQTAAIEALNQSQAEVIQNLGRFTVLNARKTQIETDYAKVEIQEGARSYLENLVRTKALVSTGYTIKDMPVSEFGGDFELAPFSIKFTANTLQALTDFLTEIVHGQHPVVLTELDFRKARGGERMEVSLDISSIKRSTNKQ